MSQHGCPERLSNRSKGFQDDSPSQSTMEVLVETLTGTAFEMTVLPTDTIFAIKSKIFRVEGIPVSQQHLLYNLVELDDSSSLREHAISDGARLRLVLGMRGGPISTRRLPPPPNAEPWRDIERLLDTNRDEGEWGGSGCKVTVLVFRDGERVNMLRVKENHDGTYSPLDHNKYSSTSSSLSQLVERESSAARSRPRAARGPARAGRLARAGRSSLPPALRVVPQAAEHRDAAPLPLRRGLLRAAPLRGGARLRLRLPRGRGRAAGARQPGRARSQAAAHLVASVRPPCPREPYLKIKMFKNPPPRVCFVFFF